MAVGAKEIETRSWATKYRGELVICAAKHWDDECAFTLGSAEVMLALEPILQFGGLPFGVALCVVELFACDSTDIFNPAIKTPERQFGNYEPGRFAWVTRNLRVLKIPVPVRGKQMIFDLSADEEKAVREQLT